MGYHKPALLNETIEGLQIRPGGIYVDLTFGGGGHSLEVLKKLGKKGRLVAFDQDPDVRTHLPDDRRFTFVAANFRYLRNFLKYHAIERVDGVMADLGISFHQVDIPSRGFSFRSDAPLDMRMDNRAGRTAEEVVNLTPREQLADLFREYGELKRPGAIAGAIDSARQKERIRTTGDLEQALSGFIPKHHPSKFLARVYQAIRIEVNQEVDSLKEMLSQTPGALRKGGRLAVISYHSVEDRLVKNFMRAGNFTGEVEKDFYGRPSSPWRLINRSVITPGEAEISENKRARSARLRIAERVDEHVE